MAAIEELADIASWRALWDEQASEGAPVRLIFKRSPHCSTSRAVEAGLERLAEALPRDGAVRVHRVDVVSAREVSQRIASDTGVRHESPQALLVGPGREVLWHASHHSADERPLSEAIERARAGGSS